MKKLSVQLYVNRLGFNITPLLLYVKDYNFRHGIDLQFNTVAVDVTGYKSSDFAPIRPAVSVDGKEVIPTINYCILLGAPALVPQSNAAIDIFMFDQSEWATPPGSAYPILPNTPTSDTIWNINKPFINYGVYPPILGNYMLILIHELIHAFGMIARSEGYNVTDVMDVMMVNGLPQAYYLNNDPWNVNGNFTRMWEQFYNSGWLKYD